jgi:predicted transcriptional regulator
MDVPTTPASHIRLDRIPVNQAMHHGIIGCSPDTPLPMIARVFADERIHCVIVHGIEERRAGEHLTWGVIHDRDLMRAIDAADGGRTAGELATPGAPTIDVDETLEHAIRLMASADVAHLIVLEQAYPVGVLSALDVAAAAGGV